MFGFMDYVQHAFYRASNWNHDNSYANLNATARCMEPQQWADEHTY